MTKRTIKSERQPSVRQSFGSKRVKQNISNEQKSAFFIANEDGHSKFDSTQMYDIDSAGQQMRIESPEMLSKTNEVSHRIKGEASQYSTLLPVQFDEDYAVNEEEIEEDLSNYVPVPTYAQKMVNINSVACASSSSFSFPSSSSFPSAAQNRWDPINFGLNNLYDFDSGVPRSRADCETAMEKLVRNPKIFDYYGYLDIASKFHGSEPEKEKLAPAIVPGKGFNLDLAAVDEETFVLPSGKSLKLSQIITPYMASNFTSSRFERDTKSLMRKIFNEIAPRDPYFSAYTAAESSTQGYISIGDRFYVSFSHYLIRGFGQLESQQLITYVIALIREVLSNFIDRYRHTFNNSMDTTAVNLAGQLKSQLARIGNQIRWEQWRTTTARLAAVLQEAECPKHLSWKKYKQQRGEESDNYLMDNENAYSTVIQL
uniref:Uncharacterized protein n=1 Tax=Caenorhabditis japonica TaxID=281687 RepID=A0A8R1DUB7_CAEJA